MISHVGIHDAFGLYGRPRLYSWDPRDPRGMMFAYPIGESKDVRICTVAYRSLLTLISASSSSSIVSWRKTWTQEKTVPLPTGPNYCTSYGTACVVVRIALSLRLRIIHLFYLRYGIWAHEMTARLDCPMSRRVNHYSYLRFNLSGLERTTSFLTSRTCQISQLNAFSPPLLRAVICRTAAQGINHHHKLL